MVQFVLAGKELHSPVYSEEITYQLTDNFEIF